MPVIHVQNAGPLDKDQRRQMARDLTKVICEVTGKPEGSVYIRIDEVPRENFAVGGKLLSDRDAEKG